MAKDNFPIIDDFLDGSSVDGIVKSWKDSGSSCVNRGVVEATIRVEFEKLQEENREMRRAIAKIKLLLPVVREEDL